MDTNKQTPLHWAARAGHLAALQQLLLMVQPPTAGAIGARPASAVDVNAFDRWFRTPLHWALLQKHFDAAALLLAEPRVQVVFSMTARRQAKRTALPYEQPLHLLARSAGDDGALDILKRLLGRMQHRDIWCARLDGGGQWRR